MDAANIPDFEVMYGSIYELVVTSYMDAPDIPHFEVIYGRPRYTPF